MLTLLSLSGPRIPIRAEFDCGISSGNVAKEFLFGITVRVVVWTSGGLDNEFTLDLEVDVVGSEWPLRFCIECNPSGWFWCLSL